MLNNPRRAEGERVMDIVERLREEIKLKQERIDYYMKVLYFREKFKKEKE
jgi:hypothetical protein